MSNLALVQIARLLLFQRLAQDTLSAENSLINLVRRRSISEAPLLPKCLANFECFSRKMKHFLAKTPH